MEQCGYNEEQLEKLTDIMMKRFGGKKTRSEARTIVIKDVAYRTQLKQNRAENKAYLGFPRELEAKAKQYLERKDLTLGDRDEAETLFDSLFYGNVDLGNEASESKYDKKFRQGRIEEFYANRNVNDLARELGIEVPKKPSEFSVADPVEAEKLSDEVKALNEEQQIITMADDFGVKPRLEKVLYDWKKSILAKNVALKEYLELKDKIDSEINLAVYQDDGDYKADELQLLMNVEETTPDKKQIEVSDLKMNFESVSKMLETNSIKLKDKDMVDLIDTPEKFKSIFGMQVANEVKSSYFTLGDSIRKGIEYTKLELSNQTSINSVAESFAGINAATAAKELKLKNKKDKTIVKTHHNVINSILLRRLSETNKFETELFNTIRSLVNIAPIVDISTGNKTFTFKSNNKIVTEEAFNQITNQVYLQNTHNLSYKNSINSIASLDINKSFMKIPSEFQARILGLSDVAVKMNETRDSLDDNQKDLLDNLRTLNRISKMPQQDLSKVNFGAVYKNVLGQSIDQETTKVSNLGYQLQAMTMENFDKYDITNYQKVMDNIVATRQDEMFSIDATEEIKQNINNKIYDEFSKGKTLYISVDSATKDISVKAITNVTMDKKPITKLVKPKEDMAYKKHLEEMKTNPVAIEYKDNNDSDGWNAESDRLWKINKVKYAYLNKAKEVTTGGNVHVIDKTILKFKTMDGLVNSYDDIIANYAKRKVEKDSLTKGEFASLSVKNKIAFFANKSEQNQNTYNRNKEVFDTQNRKILSSDIDMLSKYAPAMLNKNEPEWISKPNIDSYSISSAIDKRNKFMHKNGLDYSQRTSLSRAENNIINAQYNVAKEIIVEDRASGHRFTTINEKTKSGEPSVFMVDADHIDSDDFWTTASEDEVKKDVYRVQYKVGTLGWTKPVYYVEGDDVMYDHIAKLHEPDDGENLGDESLAAKKKKSIKLHGKTLVNDAVRKVYSIMAKGSKEKSDVINTVRNIVNETIDSRTFESFDKKQEGFELDNRQINIDTMRDLGFSEKKIDRRMKIYDKRKASQEKYLKTKTPAKDVLPKEENKKYVGKVLDVIESHHNIKTPEETMSALTSLSDYMFDEQNKLHEITTPEQIGKAVNFINYLFNKNVARPSTAVDKLIESMFGEKPNEYDRVKDYDWIDSKTESHKEAITKLQSQGKVVAEKINDMSASITNGSKTLNEINDSKHESAIEESKKIISELIKLEATSKTELVNRDEQSLIDAFKLRRPKYKNIDINSIPKSERSEVIETYFYNRKNRFLNGSTVYKDKQSEDAAWDKEFTRRVKSSSFNDDITEWYKIHQAINSLSNLRSLSDSAKLNIDKYEKLISFRRTSNVKGTSLNENETAFKTKMDVMIKHKLKYNKELHAAIEKSISTNEEILRDKADPKRRAVVLSETDYNDALEKMNKAKEDVTKINELNLRLSGLSESIKSMEGDEGSKIKTRINLQKSISDWTNARSKQVKELNDINNKIKTHTYKIDYYSSAGNEYGERILINSMNEDFELGRSQVNEKSFAPSYIKEGEHFSGKKDDVERKLPDNTIKAYSEYSKDDEDSDIALPDSKFDKTYSEQQKNIELDEDKVAKPRDEDKAESDSLDLIEDKEQKTFAGIENVQSDYNNVELSEPDRVAKNVEDLKPTDAYTFSMNKRGLDRSVKKETTKTSFKNNSELEKVLGDELSGFNQQMEQQEISAGRKTFNNRPVLMSNMATVFNQAKPFIESEYSKTTKENLIHNMNSAKPQVRFREEVLKNKDGVC